MEYEILKTEIEKVHGATFVGLDTITEVKLKGGKKNPMQGRVTKITEGANTMIFSATNASAYESMVRRRMEEEGKDASDFTLKPRAWGTRVGNTPIIEHNGKRYLECFFMNPGKTKYYLDGEPIDKDLIEGLPTTKVSDESQGGIENKVIVRTYSLESIHKIRMNGKELA